MKKIEKLKQPGRYLDAHGLYLQVISPTNKSWLLRYERVVRDEQGNTVQRPNGRPMVRERWMGLGPLHTFDLDEARDRARSMRQRLKDGIDPLDERRNERLAQARSAAKSRTFKQAAEAFYDDHEAKWKNAKHRAQFTSTLKAYVYPHLGEMAVDAVTTDDVLRVLKAPAPPRKGTPPDAKSQSFWASRPETAQRVRQRIEMVLDWSAVHGYRRAGDNPARWAGHLKHALPEKVQRQQRHHAALAWAEIACLVAELEGREGLAAKALHFLILTAARTSEVTGATWGEFDIAAKTWTIPAHRMKGGRDHIVPLSPTALAIVEDMPREAAYVFPGAKAGEPMSNMAMAAVLRRMRRPDITVHGFRSTFRDWAAERTSYPNHVVELALAHTIGDKVEKAYRRGQLIEWRQRLMGDWATFCETPAPSQGENVVAPGAGR